MIDPTILAQLTPKQRDVLRARLERGMSFRQIASALDLHEATVRGHYEAALRNIAKHMKEEAA